MSIFTRLALVNLVCLLLGCTYTVQPVLTDKDLVHDLDLNGDWQIEPDPRVAEKEPPGVVQLSGFDRNSAYDFQFGGTPPEPQDYVLKVGRVGGLTLGQISQQDPSGPPIVRGLPVYVIVKLELKDNTLTLREMCDLPCRKLLDADQVPYFVHLGARKPDIEHTVILASTPKLQEFLTRRHAEVFTGPVRVLKRMPRPK